MGIINKILPHYTYNDYINWEGRWELIEGSPIAMSPLPVPEHQRVASEIRTELTLALRASKCKRCIAYDPLDYKVSEDTIVQPDILVVCNQINKSFLDFPPVLVVEILSASTMLRDRNTKYLIYEQQEVKYYLIVDVDKKSIEVYKLINNKYELQPAGNFHFTLTEDCIISPHLQNVWGDIDN